MVLHEPTLAIAYNGEVYNHLELRRELEGQGARFRSGTDTEVLLHAYARWGTGMLDRLVGMFAFAIWDESKRELFLARDRAGEKPLYYAAHNSCFAFASEVQALASTPGITGAIDHEALALYLEYQYVPAPRSIYEGISKLPPAHAMTVRDGRLRVWRYWDPVTFALEPRLFIDERTARDELERLLRQAVSGQMVADVPLGAFLSGGIDSSAVVSLMAELSPSKVNTFTIGFDVDGYDESQHSARVARHIGTNHTVEYLTEDDALELVPRIPAMYGEPFADSSALPTHLVAQVARKQVTVALSGDGGDEAFGGYNRYFPFIRPPVTRVLARPFRPWLAAARPFLFGRAERLVGRLSQSEREVFRTSLILMPGDHAARLSGARPPLPEYERAWDQPVVGGAYRSAMLADLLTYLPEAILVKVDRAAMAVSLETRAPLLDHRLLEFSLRLPVRFAHRKRLLKHVAFRRVPRALLERPKQGFGVPIGRWFRGRLRALLQETLSPAALDRAGIRDVALVQRYVRDHLQGVANHEARLWALLVLCLWDEKRVRRGHQDTREQLVAAG
jgi:asparagine synthase (glutamine-hydrolysing)